MGKQAKRAYLEAIMGRYRIRLMGRKKSTSPRRRPGRRPKYDHPQLLEALRRIWLASDQLGGKRLKVALHLWLPHYEAEHGALPGAVRAGLLAASASTLDRRLKAARGAPHIFTSGHEKRRPEGRPVMRKPKV